MFPSLLLDEPLLVGISGGADSVALLYLLLEHGYRHLTLCHFNHQLRGADADADALFVQELAASLQLPYEVGTEDVRARATREKLSLEAAAREARYEFFATIAQQRGLPKLLLAHHADDQVETCFLHFLRGTGSAGLAGMLPVSRRTIHGIDLTIVRPLLAVSKKELLSLLTSRNLSYREDATNASLLPTRNRLRHRLLPLLDELFGTTYRNAITRTATILAAEDDYLESLAAPHAKEPQLKTKEISLMPIALQRRIVHTWLRNHGFQEVSFAEVELVLSLLNLDGPAKINLPAATHARRRSGLIFLEKL
jgi:tRNA(Ile)-lysidine synthase